MRWKTDRKPMINFKLNIYENIYKFCSTLIGVY